MKFTVFFFLLFPLVSISQFSGCFKYADQVYEEFNFNDSAFTYSHSVGLSHASVSGKYKIQNDTLILNSQFQPDDYELNSFHDSLVKENFISVQIKEIESANQLDVRSRIKGQEYLNFNSTIISHSKSDVFLEEIDTIVREYLIPRDSISDNLEVKIWRKGQTITLPIDSNRCQLDLTNYPQWLDYVFFKNQKAILVDNSIVLLDEFNNPIKTKYTVKKRKMITTSKKMKIKKYTKCT